MQPNNGLIFRVLKTPPSALAIDPTAHRVLLILLDYWNPKQSGPEVRPGLERLAWQSGLSPSTLKRAIAKLESADLIKTSRRPNKSNRYMLQVALIGSLCDAAPKFNTNDIDEDEAPTQRKMALLGVVDKFVDGSK